MTPITTPTTVPASAPELRVLGCVAREAGLGDAACDEEELVLVLTVGEGELVEPLDPEGDVLLLIRQLVSCPSSTKNGLEVADIPAVPEVSNATTTYDPSWTSTESQVICWALEEIASVSVRDTRVVPLCDSEAGDWTPVARPLVIAIVIKTSSVAVYDQLMVVFWHVVALVIARNWNGDVLPPTKQVKLPSIQVCMLVNSPTGRRRWW